MENNLDYNIKDSNPYFYICFGDVIFKIDRKTYEFFKELKKQKKTLTESEIKQYMEQFNFQRIWNLMFYGLKRR